MLRVVVRLCHVLACRVWTSRERGGGGGGGGLCVSASGCVAGGATACACVVHFVGDVVHIKGYVRRVDSVSLTVGLPSGDTTGTLAVTWGVYGDTTVRANRIVRATFVMGGSASCLASHYCPSETPIALAPAESSSPRHFLVSQA